jgi:hypothetical protein
VEVVMLLLIMLSAGHDVRDIGIIVIVVARQDSSIICSEIGNWSEEAARRLDSCCLRGGVSQFIVLGG